MVQNQRNVRGHHLISYEQSIQLDGGSVRSLKLGVDRQTLTEKNKDPWFSLRIRPSQEMSKLKLELADTASVERH